MELIPVFCRRDRLGVYAMCFPDDPNIVEYHCRTGVGFASIQSLRAIWVVCCWDGNYLCDNWHLGWSFWRPTELASGLANDSHTAFQRFVICNFVIGDVRVL